MRLSQAWLVARHDLNLYRHRRTILYALVAFPLGVAIGFPVLVRYLLSRVGPASIPSPVLVGLIDSFSFFFVIASATLPIAVASYSIVGEKIEKSLEPLLATPTTDGEILLGKALAALVPTLAAIWASSVLYIVLMDRVTVGHLGYLFYPNAEIAVVLLALAPLACLFAVEVSILISARVADVRTAQQIGGIVFLPFVLLYVVSEVGIVTLDTLHLLAVSGGLALVTLGLFALSRRAFEREEILTRWK